jgi:hypothetical protein
VAISTIGSNLYSMPCTPLSMFERYSLGLIGVATAESRVIDYAERD